MGTKHANNKDVTHTEVEGQGQIERKESKRQADRHDGFEIYIGRIPESRWKLDYPDHQPTYFVKTTTALGFN